MGLLDSVTATTAQELAKTVAKEIGTALLVAVFV
jgi:hypothetical protein